MAAFSGHRGDGDELLGCCFSFAYSHGEERWWEKRGEDEFPLLSFSRRGSSPSAFFFFFFFRALLLPCSDVLSSPVSDVIAVAFETWRNKMFFPCPGATGVTLSSPPHLPSFHHPPPPPLNSPSSEQDSSHAGRKECTSLSPPFHSLLF